MDEQSEEAAQKHVLLQQHQLAVCKQVGWKKKWKKTENLKTFHSLWALTSYHYLHFSSTIIRFFLFLMGRGRGYKDVFCMNKAAHNDMKEVWRMISFFLYQKFHLIFGRDRATPSDLC